MRPPNVAKNPRVDPTKSVYCWDCSGTFQHKHRKRHFKNFPACVTKCYYSPDYRVNTNLFTMPSQNRAVAPSVSFEEEIEEIEEKEKPEKENEEKEKEEREKEKKEKEEKEEEEKETVRITFRK